MRAALLGTATCLAVATVLGRLPTRAASRPGRPAVTERQRRGVLAGLVVGTGLASPVIPPLLLLAWWTRRRVRSQRAHRSHANDVRRALPEVVDLFALASTAGLSLPVAHPLVARHAPPPLAAALHAAHLAAAAGRPRAEALVQHLAPLGERSHALGQVLADHLRYGVPLLPALERTGLELRLDRRRAAEQEARRVPVRLLGPLVACVLPAFALLTVVPLLAASLDALPT